MSWKGSLAAADAAVAGYFDEDACSAVAFVKPPRAVNSVFEPDPSRASFDFLGTIERDPSMSTMMGGGSVRGEDRQSRPVAKVCLTALTTGWPWLLRQGDHVVCGSETFSVAAAPERDGTKRVAIWLNAVNG